MKKARILSNFFLKIMAIIFMTCDHVAIFIAQYDYSYYDSNGYYILRYLGRLAMPLFVFLLIEGIFKSKNRWKYVLRMGIACIAIMIPYIIIEYFAKSIKIEGNNAFIDLFMLSLMFTLFLDKRKYIKPLSLLPLFYLIFSSTIDMVEMGNEMIILWFPRFLRAGYGIYALILAVALFLCRPLADISARKMADQMGTSVEIIRETSDYQGIINIFSIIMMIVTHVLMWIVFCYLIPQYDFLDMNYQALGLFALIPIIFYNGKRGYNAKWFQYGCYLYYPLHLVIIYVICELVYFGSITLF